MKGRDIMNKKKIISILIMLVLILLATSTICLADTAYAPANFKGYIDTTDSDASGVKSLGGRIVGIVRTVSTIVSVAMLIVLGIKYMMGSAEERAEYKKTLFPYFIGAILIFAAGSLTQIIYTWASKL